MAIFAVAVVDRFDFEIDHKLIKAKNWHSALQKFETKKNEKSEGGEEMQQWIDEIPNDKEEARRYYLDTDRTFSVKRFQRRSQ